MLNIDKLKEMYPDIPLDIWQMLRELDAFTYNHSIRVCEICRLIERESCAPDSTLSEAGLLHDIGKYCYSQKILGKHGGLNSLERDIIDAHAYLSYIILQHYHLPDEVCEIALYHHRLKPTIFDNLISECTTDDIAKQALILKAVDVFEALTTDRPYHRGISNRKALDILRDMKCDETIINILADAKELER